MRRGGTYEAPIIFCGGVQIVADPFARNDPGGCGSIRQPDMPMTIAMKPEDLERLVSQTMPYGKYKGRLIADLPGNYLNWFARVGFPPGSLGQLLELMHEIDHNGLSALLEPLRRRNASRG